MNLSNVPKDTCPLCRQVALDRSGVIWRCRSCGCELEFDPLTRRTRVVHFPDEYAVFESVVGTDWLTRSQMFERAEVAYGAQIEGTRPTAPRWFGPAVITTLVLGMTCIILAAIAAAMVLSPSVARTRRVISAAYQATPSLVETLPAVAINNPALEGTLDSPLLTTTPDDQSESDSFDFVETTVGDPVQDSDLQMPTPTSAVVDPSQGVAAPTLAPAPVSAPDLPLPGPQELPPTFTPLPPAEPSAPLVLNTPTPVIQAETPTPIATAMPPAEMPTVAVLPTSVFTPVQKGSLVFRGTVRILSVQPVGSGPNQASEYVELYNEGPQQVDLNGWTLKAIRLADNTILDIYRFGNGAIIAAGQICRIYTNILVAPDNCGFAGGFASSTPIWPDDGGAQASLFDPQNVEHARFTY